MSRMWQKKLDEEGKEIMIICPNCAHHDQIKVNILGYDQCTCCGYVFPEKRHSVNDIKTYKVKPRKVTRNAFCGHCGKKVEFYLDWMGCAWLTDKGIVTYRELEARCPHCFHEIYVPAVNDVNVYRRNKAYAEQVPEEPLKIGTQEDLIKMCEEKI